MTDNETTSRWERRKERTRRRLLEEAQRLFKAKGFDNTTVEEIAAAADVAKGTFFNYFESKESLLGDLLYNQMHALFAAPPLPEAPAPERIRRLLQVMWLELAPYRHLSQHMFVHAMTHPLPEHFVTDRLTATHVLTSLIEAGQADGVFRPEINAELAGSLLATYFFRLCIMECVENSTSSSCGDDRMQEALNLLYEGMLIQ
jgi:AcrR family transcriptional regulator